MYLWTTRCRQVYNRKKYNSWYLFRPWHLATGCEKTLPDGDDGWGTITSLCREYTYSRSFPKSQVLAAIPEGTVIGPVLEAQTATILDGYGIEVLIPSIAKPANTSYVVMSRETERFVNEIHDQKRRAQVQ